MGRLGVSIPARYLSLRNPYRRAREDAMSKGEVDLRKSQGREIMEAAWRAYQRDIVRLDAIRDKFNLAVSSTQNDKGRFPK